jgi:drug/metabolite transporter (DMT)-like permease
MSTGLTGKAPSREESTKTHRLVKLKTFLMILVMVVCGPLGNVLLGRGMKQVGAISFWPLSELLPAALHTFTTASIWMGIGSLIVFFVAYMLALSWADYSFVQPASSLAYGVAALLGYLMLGEHVSLLRWLGIGIICLGVFVVGHTNPSTINRVRAEPS